MIFKIGENIKNFYVNNNSLYIMSGESRWDWSHEIKGVKNDIIDGKRVPRKSRISITFRSNNEDTTNMFEE